MIHHNIFKMKKLLFFAAIGFAMSACSGTDDYKNYVETLRNQPAGIDTISSAQSYAAYIDSITAKAEAFDALDIKLDETQTAEIASLGLKIQEALSAKYEQLAQTPMILPDSIEVPE